MKAHAPVFNKAATEKLRLQYVKKPKMVVLDVKMAVRLLKVKKSAPPGKYAGASSEVDNSVHARLEKQLRLQKIQSKRWHAEVSGLGGLWGVSPQFYPPLLTRGGVGGFAPQAELEALARREESDAKKLAAFKRFTQL
jgi:hypothetical protein